MIRRGRIVAVLLCAALAPGPAAAFSVLAQRVPFVGCPLDGQTGPAPAPSDGPRPLLDPHEAGRLAYYGADGLGILAPRGWHCIAVSGSNGISLVVTPDRRRPADLIDRAAIISGPGISISRRYGGTSGRFAVAEAIARYFPALRGSLPTLLRNSAETVPDGPWPGDAIKRRGEYEIRFATPAGMRGEGTVWLFAPEGGPVEGAVLILPEEPDAIIVRVRLPKSDSDLAELVIAWNPAIAQ